MTTDELKPCPFCGGEATWSDQTPRHWVNNGIAPFQLGCSNSSCPVNPYSKIFKTEKAAIAAWNRRANEPQITR